MANQLETLVENFMDHHLSSDNARLHNTYRIMRKISIWRRVYIDLTSPSSPQRLRSDTERTAVFSVIIQILSLNRAKLRSFFFLLPAIQGVLTLCQPILILRMRMQKIKSWSKPKPFPIAHLAPEAFEGIWWQNWISD